MLENNHPLVSIIITFYNEEFFYLGVCYRLKIKLIKT